MGINMASETRGQYLLISVERPTAGALVAPGAVRHDLVIVLLAGIIDMILSVAAHAVNLVPGSFFLDSLKNREMTLTALYRGKGLHLHLIRRHLGFGSSLFCLC
jgi:hypothetical protein